MTDQLLLHGVLDQRLVQAAWNPAKAREKVASLGIARILFQPHRQRSARVGQPFKQCPGSVDLEQGARQRHTILLRATAQGTATRSR